MIARERLARLVLGDVDERERAELEEHLLECSACAAVTTELVTLSMAIADGVRAGWVALAPTPALLARIEAEGLVSRRYVVPQGGIVPCTVARDDVYVLARLEADLRGVTRVDVRHGGETLADLPFDPGGVHLLSRGADLRRLPTAPYAMELVAVDPDGERSLGIYTFDHTAGED